MRNLAMMASGLVLILTGYTLVRADAPASVPTTTTVIHVDVTPKVEKVITSKMPVGDTCTVMVRKAKTGDGYDVMVRDTTAKGARAKGTLEETALIAPLDLKKLRTVSWTIAAGDKAHQNDVLTLTTTDTLPTK